jgi:FkbM family methyltransferase
VCAAYRWFYYYDNPEIVSVKASSLDAYLEERDFHIVVVDTEGSEYFALQGMQELLSNCRVLVVEFLPHHLKNVSGVTIEQFL